MNDYYKIILKKLVDSYERREGFLKKKEEIRAIQIQPATLFKEYTDRYNHEAYKNINVAIERLERQGLVFALRDTSGNYTKVKLNVDAIDKAYTQLGRSTVPELFEVMKSGIKVYENHDNELIRAVSKDFMELLNNYKKLPYDLQFNDKRLDDLMRTLCAIVVLSQETYIRNFSTAIFKDSKMFNREMRSLIESVLYDYSDIIVEKERILEAYNLFDNPTYVLIKGEGQIKYKHSIISLADMVGGLAIPNTALEEIIEVTVSSEKIITVENLTTYHDADEKDGMFIYLGGFHSSSKEKFLKLVFSQNQDNGYYHKGDIDVYGFAILENLKHKTGIPFEPLEMDIETLERFYKNGLYKELTSKDKEAMGREKLKKYMPIFKFMLDHNCKVEQESIKAVQIMEQV